MAFISFTEEILNGKIHFLCSDIESAQSISDQLIKEVKCDDEWLHWKHLENHNLCPVWLISRNTKYYGRSNVTTWHIRIFISYTYISKCNFWANPG